MHPIAIQLALRLASKRVIGIEGLFFLGQTNIVFIANQCDGFHSVTSLGSYTVNLHTRGTDATGICRLADL